MRIKAADWLNLSGFEKHLLLRSLAKNNKKGVG